MHSRTRTYKLIFSVGLDFESRVSDQSPQNMECTRKKYFNWGSIKQLSEQNNPCIKKKGHQINTIDISPQILSPTKVKITLFSVFNALTTTMPKVQTFNCRRPKKELSLNL